MKYKLPSKIATAKRGKLIIAFACAVVVPMLVTPADAADLQVLHDRIHGTIAKLAPLGHLPPANRLNLVIGLPMRNRVAFSNLLQQLYDPTSPNFHHYLTPGQFTARFGPTEADYKAVTDFATAHGLQVVKTYGDRKILDVSAAVSDIERAFNVKMNTYKHPTENRIFYAPDVEITVDASLPILSVSGLDNFVLPHPMAVPMVRTRAGSQSGGGGSGPSAAFFGWDFRNAYAPGVTLDGSGQYVGLVEFTGYWPSDITAYETNASPALPNVTLTNVYSDGVSTGLPPAGTDTAECSLDIEMAIAMAPGLAGVYVFEGGNSDHILGKMVSYQQIKQFSCSWGMSNDTTAEQYLEQMQMQGQTFCQASGDGDAYVTFPIYWPADDPNVLSCGGTELVMSKGAFSSETVWNTGPDPNGPWCCNGQNSTDAYWGSGGGVSSVYPIPAWQQSVNMTAVGGSSTWRNLPDVALTAEDIYVYCDNGTGNGPFMGTSCAAPLWAGFIALVNQQAVQQGQSSVGFITPALYGLAQTQSYNSIFNDIPQGGGNNTWPGSPNQYYAYNGYDLCTGWGSPKGQAMINALLGPVYVDFNYTGAPQTGSWDMPFKTLTQGANAVLAGGTIYIKTAGSSSETPTMANPPKAMTIIGIGGAATIGSGH